MPDDIANVEIEGLDKLLAHLDVKKWHGGLVATLWACAEVLKDGVADYPPETEANQPRAPNTVFSIKTHRPINRWYVRGKGTVTCSGRVYYTSQDLGHQWTVRVKDLTAEVGNAVSYGPYVQGSKQVWYHKARGWKTIFQVVKEKSPAIHKLLRIAVDRLLSSPPTALKGKL